MSPSYLSHPVPQQGFPGATLNWMASKGLCKLQSAMHVREVPPWFSLWHCHIGQLLGHVLGHYLKNQGKPEASAFTCQGFCWHNHGWLEAAWRCRRAWHLDEQVPLSFGGLHLGVAVHSQKPPQADSLLHVLKQIRNKRQEKVVRTSHTGVETLLWAPRVPLIRNGCGLVILSLGSDHAGYMNTSDCFLKLTLAFVHLQPVIWATDSKHLHTMFPLVTSIFFIIFFNNGIYEDLKLYQGQNLLYTWCWGLR